MTPSTSFRYATQALPSLVLLFACPILSAGQSNKRNNPSPPPQSNAPAPQQRSQQNHQQQQSHSQQQQSGQHGPGNSGVRNNGGKKPEAGNGATTGRKPVGDPGPTKREPPARKPP